MEHHSPVQWACSVCTSISSEKKNMHLQKLEILTLIRKDDLNPEIFRDTCHVYIQIYECAGVQLHIIIN